MTLAYVLDKILTNSLLIFFFYSCFATLILSLVYLITEEVQRIMEEKREQAEILQRTGRSTGAIVDEIYES